MGGVGGSSGRKRLLSGPGGTCADAESDAVRAPGGAGSRYRRAAARGTGGRFGDGPEVPELGGRVVRFSHPSAWGGSAGGCGSRGTAVG